MAPLSIRFERRFQVALPSFSRGVGDQTGFGSWGDASLVDVR